jgi:hypothetical protein
LPASDPPEAFWQRASASLEGSTERSGSVYFKTLEGEIYG